MFMCTKFVFKLNKKHFSRRTFTRIYSPPRTFTCNGFDILRAKDLHEKKNSPEITTFRDDRTTTTPPGSPTS